MYPSHAVHCPAEPRGAAPRCRSVQEHIRRAPHLQLQESQGLPVDTEVQSATTLFIVTPRKRSQGRQEPPRHRSQLSPPHHKCTSPVQHEARRQSPFIHANRSQEWCIPSPHAAHSRAEPEDPRRGTGAPQTRAAPSKSRPGRVGSARARMLLKR